MYKQNASILYSQDINIRIKILCTYLLSLTWISEMDKVIIIKPHTHIYVSYLVLMQIVTNGGVLHYSQFTNRQL